MKRSITQNEKDLFASLHSERQKLMLQAYLVYFVSSFFTTYIIVSYKPFLTLQEKIIQTSVSSVLMFFTFLILFISYKFIHNYKQIDTVVLLMTLTLYSIVVLFSQTQKILATLILFPGFFLLIFTTMDKIKISVFVIIHLFVTVYFYIADPTFTVEVMPYNYFSIAVITCLVLFTAYRLSSVFENYQYNISQDLIELNQKNQELNALNEEYYATQEELFEKYDEVIRLNAINEQYAFFDALTQFSNRNGFIRRLDQLVAEGREDYVLTFVDVKNFKDINSVYGYHMGDELLIQITESIQAFPIDYLLIARISGDLFGLITENTTTVDQLLLYLNSLNQTYYIQDSEIAAGIKCGILSKIDPNKSTKGIIQSVDIALNKAKERTNSFFYIYDDQLQSDIEKRVKMTQALESAIKSKHITCVYQPIIDSKSQNTVGFETLARWIDANFGYVSPSEFIPLAEKTHLIEHLGTHVIHTACGVLQKLQEIDSTLNISINVSGNQLANPDFSENLQWIVNSYSLNYSSIALEVTETDLIKDIELAKRQLTLLREKGFLIYLDDFGTGYSSLNYLSQLPIDVLKIDRSFITDLHLSQKKQHLLHTILILASELNIKTIAEGVELQVEYELLKEMGIDRIQGYYFSKPLPETKLLSCEFTVSTETGF